ncbi:MAG: thiolase family protein [Saprospiraceae bacterium]|nr:thiolase family protein [Saprospiraceae bacterium]HMW40211.1 thiolase family protein [Saprospiraceae bacterium]HMX89014.1 thiolase family protein [Saprospiraceae bacterium]HMZ40090.1 thiolase family protein [Saprospiraceae bacterium]HNA64956.1 thiolase family protein [Saprospiraceae bacterium]
MQEEGLIVACQRTAFAKAKRGGFRFMRADDLAVDCLRQLWDRLPGLDKGMVDDLVVGCANPEGEQGLQIGRQIAIRAFGQSVPGMTVNRYCASGLETIAIATAKIRAGMGSVYVAGGVESMSSIPMEGYKLAVNYDVSVEHPDYVIGMGLTAEAVASKYKISREAQDEFAVRSHSKAESARSAGLFAKELGAVKVHEVYFKDGRRAERDFVVGEDEGIRADTSIEALSALKPVFAAGGSVTAGNSSQTTDGAGFVVVMSAEIVRHYGLSPLGRIVSCSVAGVDPLYMGIGPCAAIPLALKSAGLTLNDISLVELNEAFAAQSIAVIRKAGLDPEKVNVNGGAIALGHPLGCSGARLTMTILNELARRKQRYGLVTACVGGGQGIAAVVENFII